VRVIRGYGVVDGTPTVFLALEPQNLDRLREGQPIKVNLRYLDPEGPPVRELPEVDVVILYGGRDELDLLRKIARPRG
jgi:hypothetical protein